MATIKYLIQGKSDNVSIYLRLSLSKNISKKRKTGLYINPNSWSIKKGLPKQNDSVSKEIFEKLKKLESYVFEQLNSLNDPLKGATNDWLEQVIDQYFDRNQKGSEIENGLIDYCHKFLSELKNKVNDQRKEKLAPSTIRKYTTITNKLTAFEEHLGNNLLITDVNLSFRRDFMDFLRTREKLMDNTVGRYLKCVKTICFDARKNGYKTSNQLDHFKGFTIKSPIITLSVEEIGVVKNAEINDENLLITRDWLIIGCYTGQRVSDLLQINKSKIQKIKGYDFIIIKQQKTGKTVQIPIHDEVYTILMKRNGDFPPIFSKNIDSSKAMFNKYLKDLCEKAGLYDLVEGHIFDDNKKQNVFGKYPKFKLISSHVCRRSFATNFYSQEQYPTPLLMNITGHSTEKMFLEYIGKKPIDYSLQLAQLWNPKL